MSGIGWILAEPGRNPLAVGANPVELDHEMIKTCHASPTFAETGVEATS